MKLKILKSKWICWAIGFTLVAVACILALCVGRYPLSMLDCLRFFLSTVGLVRLDSQQYGLLYNLIVEIRLPRVLAAVMVGASLSASGAAFQAVFRNPLVSPGLLGVLAGASAGAAIGILINGSWFIIQLFAFAFGLLAVAFGVGIAHLFGKGSVIMLILGGILSGALFSSLLSGVKYVADPYDQLPTIVYWLMGSLGQVNLQDMRLAAIPMVCGIIVLSMWGKCLDALTMGDDEARALGVPVNVIRLSVIVTATLICALTVSIAGMIGWIGLIVPHIARLLVGPANTRLLPVTACLGAMFLLMADGFARNIFSAEIPIGIVTELLGIPVFLFVLHRVRKGWI
jgi:iron complex transport system permease protein